MWVEMSLDGGTLLAVDKSLSHDVVATGVRDVA
jgi:hypothetical protein